MDNFSNLTWKHLSQYYVSDCSTVNTLKDEPRKGLSSLILGACYNIQNDIIKAEICFRKCLEQRRHEAFNAEDAHISAFARYELGNILIHNQQVNYKKYKYKIYSAFF